MIQSARQRGPVVPGSDDAQSHRAIRSFNSPRKQPFHHVPLPLINQWNRTTNIFFWMGVGILAIITIAPIILLEEMSNSDAVHPTSLHALLQTSQNLRSRWLGGKAGPSAVSSNGVLPSVPVSSTEAPKDIKWVPAQRGHIQCDVNVDDMVYWNDPQSSVDQYFRSPFLPHDEEERFLTFEPDSGGWNNIRMSLEILVVFAATTGRTLVLPPKEPMYLLGVGQGSARSFGSFFPLNHPELQKHVKVITMKEFIETHGPKFLTSESLSEDQIKRHLLPVADTCIFQSDSDMDCNKLNVHLRQRGYQPPLEAFSHCFLFDETYYTRAYTKGLSQDGERINQFCGNRTAVAYAATFSKYKWIHWQASDKNYRLLNHFYSFLHFTNVTIGNHYKRLVRDFLHYTDDIFCAAGKIVHALESLQDGKEKGATPSFSTLHIRRGDFQYHRVKLTAEEWVKNTINIFQPGEVLYIATDELNKTFFEPFIKQGYQVRFLDDYFKQYGLSNLDGAFMGMIDTIVASHGRAFVGTWFSTFSGYINRMRGYLGYDMKNSWYGWLPRQTAMHKYDYPHFPWPVREWPLGWEGIDENVAVASDSSLKQAEAGGIVQKAADGNKDKASKKEEKPFQSKQRKLLNITLAEIASSLSDTALVQDLPLARGIAGRPMSQTPALIGAHRGHIDCDINVDSLAYWNNPQGERDINFKSPYAVEVRYRLDYSSGQQFSVLDLMINVLAEILFSLYYRKAPSTFHLHQIVADGTISVCPCKDFREERTLPKSIAHSVSASQGNHFCDCCGNRKNAGFATQGTTLFINGKFVCKRSFLNYFPYSGNKPLMCTFCDCLSQ